MKDIIEVGGGAVIWEEEVSSVDKKLLANAIRLVTPTEASLLIESKVKEKNAFYMKYVFECINKSAILMNLSNFKVIK